MRGFKTQESRYSRVNKRFKYDGQFFKERVSERWIKLWEREDKNTKWADPIVSYSEKEPEKTVSFPTYHYIVFLRLIHIVYVLNYINFVISFETTAQCTHWICIMVAHHMSYPLSKV